MNWIIRINHNGEQAFLALSGDLSYTQATRKALQQAGMTFDTIESITGWKE